MSNTLRITNNFGNKYEFAKARLKQNPLFKESHWTAASKGNSNIDLDMYIATLGNLVNADTTKLQSDYNYDYGDATTQMAALYNEAFKDSLVNSTHTMERNVTDEKGNVIYKDRKPVTEKYEISDYDYYKDVIKLQNDYKQQQWFRLQEIERKNSLSDFSKFLSSIASVPLEVLSGSASVVDAAIDTVSAVASGVSATINGERFDDAFTKAISDEEWRPFDEFQDWVVDFERRYTGIRDIDGNYTNIGKYVGGIAYTVGQMLPSILLTKVGGIVGGKVAGAAGSAIAKGSSIASQVIYYESMSANNIRDMYNKFAAEQVSVPTAQILTNAALKSTLEYGIERILGSILGGTALDDVVFGRTAGRTNSKASGNLTKAGIKRLLKEAGQEGLEEVLQETSSFFVDRAYSIYTENFGEITDLTFQSLIDSFVIGSIVSLGGSAVRILKADGKPMKALGKGGKIAAWEYGLNMQSFVENYNKVLNADKKARRDFSNADDLVDAEQSVNKQAKLASAAMTEMYASYRILSSIYGEIGEARFNAANSILNKITSNINDGKYDLSYLKSQATEVYNSILGERTLSKEVSDKLKKDIEDAEITRIVDEAVAGQEIDDPELKKVIEEVFNATDLEKVLVSEDGNNVVKNTETKTAIIPKNYLKNASKETIIYTFCEQDLIDKIVNDKYYKFITDDILEVYKDVSGESDATLEKAVTSLLFDPELVLFKSLLVTANKDMYKFLSNLTLLLKGVKVDKLSDALYKNTLDKCVKSMTAVLVEYLKNQPNADYNLDLLTNAQKKSIARVRWSKDIYSRVVKGDKLSKTDLTVLENRVKYANIDEASKSKILENIKSANVDVRYNAMNAIDYAYDMTFSSKYDGKTYLPNSGIPNVVFNNYLQRHGLTLSTINSVNSLSDSDLEVINDIYGEVNETTALQYRIKQFSDSVNNLYSLEKSDDGKYYVLDENGQRVGYSIYNAKIANIISGDALYKDGKEIKRTASTAAGDLKSIVRSLLRPGLDKFTANMLSITDVIVDSSLLNESIVKSIQYSYGKVTPETTFTYLRDYLIDKTGDTTITVKSDGDYAFVNVKPMESSLISQDFKITGDVTASELFKLELLNGMLKDLKIILTNDDIVAEYRPFRLEAINGKQYRTYDNAIYINKNVAKNGGNLLKFALLHEFQHAIQYENGFNLGMDYELFNDVSSDLKHKIIQDVKRHMPHLFNNNMSDEDVETRVQEFIYNTSGESTAMGLDATPLVDFYPTIVKYTKDSTEITFPWGTTYDLQNGIKVLGINVQEGPLSNPLNKLLLNSTKSYSLKEFENNPRSVFVMPNGDLRRFDESRHNDVIRNSGITDAKYLRSIPQIYVEDDFARVKMPASLTNEAILSVMSAMDCLYEGGVEFDLGGMDMDENVLSVTVGSDEAPNSDELLELYARYKTEASGKMSFYNQFKNKLTKKKKPVYRLDIDNNDFYSIELPENLREIHKYCVNYIHDSKIIDRSTLESLLTSNDGIKYKDVTLRLAYERFGDGMTYEEFLNSDINFCRTQSPPRLEGYNFLSVCGGVDTPTDLYELFTNFIALDYLYLGNFKVKDCLCYFDTVETEFLVPTEKLDVNDVYKIGIKPLDYRRSPDMEFLPVDDTNGVTHLAYKYIEHGKFEDLHSGKSFEMDINDPTVFEARDIANTYDFLSKNEYVFTSPNGEELTETELFDSYVGEYIPKMSLAKSNKTISTETQPTKTPKKRYLSQKEAKGTPLEKFTEKYTKTRMSEELKNFILSSTKYKLAKSLQDKIDDGTLTSKDVMDYFRNTDLKKMDDDTFNAINDAFFHNDIIKNKEDLQKHIDNTALYYATRVIVQGSRNEALLNADLDITEPLLENIKNTPKDSAAGKMYDKLYRRYYYKGKEGSKTPIEISEKYLKWLWMEHFDGTLQSAGSIANMVRYASIHGWNVTGEIKTKSLEDTIGEDLTLADTVEDKSALQDMMDIVLNSDRNEKESKLKYKLSKKMFELIAEKYGKTTEGAKSALKAKRIIDELTTDQLNEIYIRQMLSEVLGLTFDTLESKAMDNALEKVERTPWSIVNNINSNIRTIKNKLTPKEAKLFAKYNADLFTDDLKLRPDVYKSPDVKGRLVYKSAEELNKLWERIRDIKDDVIQGAYESKTRLNKHIKFKKAMIELNEATLKALNEPVKKAKDVKTVTIEVADDVISVDTTKPMPKALERILDFEFSKVVKSKTQYLTNDDSYHFQNNLKTFLNNNVEYLESLTQQDVDDIIDYYTNSEILKVNMSESKYRLYNAVQLYMSVYLLRGNKLGWFVLSEDQYKALEKRTEVTVSVAAQQLSDWKAAMKMLKPEEVIINALAKSTGIEFNANDIEDISNAIQSGDIKRIQEAKKKMYLNAKGKWDGRKNTFWDKLLQFERIAMLSGPGTWVRNIVSNATIGGVYINGKQVTPGLLDTAEVLGNKASKLIEKLFPKKKWQREKQYKITGTVVTGEVKTFIDNNLIKNGLLNELIDGLSKYDVRKSKDRTDVENITDMVTRSIATKIFYANASDIKALDTVYKFVYKMLSDDKYVTRNMLKYLGKILVEDNVDLSQGLSQKVTDCISEAYTMAAQDYMHKPNVWNKIDAAIKNKGNVAYFAYKQFLPFASTSWNWFMEGLNYTPVGLVKSIIQFAKLENTIDKLENARQKGDVVISSRFAEYNVRRNIGKGVIGTIGTFIGILLSAFGVAKLDEEDNKYKLTIGGISVDISDLFGTQGIFLGMSVTGTIIDSCKNKDFDFMDIMAKTFDAMLLDSAFADIWNTVRYNSSLGDYVAMLPMKVLDSCVPNFFKTLSSVSNVYKVKYNAGILGKIEKLAVNAVPGLAYAFPHYIDVYTGEKQIMYKAQFITNLVNKLSPLDIKPMNVTDTEKTAVNLGVKKTMLTGRYTVNDKDVSLSASDVEKLNVYYGELNKKDLAELTSNKASYKVKNENGTYSKLKYNQMTDKQRKAVFEQIMSKNGSYAKIYILTSNGYKYYASSSEYDELRKLGIVNVYKETSKLKGFVKTN